VSERRGGEREEREERRGKKERGKEDCAPKKSAVFFIPPFLLSLRPLEV